MKRVGIIFTATVLALAGSVYACGKSDSGGGGKKKGGGSSAGKMEVSGQLALGLNLQAAPRVSHVMAVSPQGGERVVAKIASDNTFSLKIDKTKTWILAFLDDSKTGSDMVVARFKSDVLDSLMPAEGVDKSIALGSVTPPAAGSADKAAEVALSFAALAEKLGLTTAGAQFAGQVDDVCLRYLNPDVDGNGEIDAVESAADGKSRNFMLDFHNRFDPKTAGGQNIVLANYKNAMPEVASISHSSSGLMLYMPKSYLPEQPTTFSNRFEGVVNGETANTWIDTTFDASYPSSDDAWNLHYELGATQPPDGKYEIKLPSGQIFTFTDVKVSDLSAPVGFLVPVVRINVDAATDYIQSVDWKWIKKTDSGFVDATTEEVKLVVAGTGAYLGIYFTGQSDLGFTIGKEATGNVAASVTNRRFADISRGPGLSYDDKLGMRMFVNIYE